MSQKNGGKGAFEDIHEFKIRSRALNRHATIVKYTTKLQHAMTFRINGEF